MTPAVSLRAKTPDQRGRAGTSPLMGQGVYRAGLPADHIPSRLVDLNEHHLDDTQVVGWNSDPE